MIGLVDYGTGNLTSVANSLDRLKVNYFKGSTASELSVADKIIFPGIGEAKTAMDSIEKQGLTSFIRSLRIPFLGICIGLQILFEHTEERDTDCIGVIGSNIKRFEESSLKVPQIGWNKVSLKVNFPLFDGIDDGEYFYFVNSYYAPLIPETIAVTEYGVDFSSALQKDNFYAVQFHTEKSGIIGEKLLKNFIELC